MADIRNIAKTTIVKQNKTILKASANAESMVFLFLKFNMSKIKNTNYFTVQGWMVNELKLSSNELLIFAVIYGFSQDGCSEFTGSLNYLCDFINSTKPTVIKSLKSLTDKGYLIKTDRPLNGQNFPTYRSYPFDLNSGKVSLLGVQASLPLDSKDSLLGGKDPLPNINNYNNSNDINSDIDPPPKIPKSFKIITEKEFQDELRAIHELEPAKFSKFNINKFFNHWSEKDASGKMKFQKQETWETKKRLIKWISNGYQ